MKQSRSVILKRRDQILRLAQRHGEVLVKDLCAALRVSEITVRRDLQEMERQGVLERFHGGARSRQNAAELPYFDDKKNAHMREKNRIAEVAAGMIAEESTVFCNAGTTTLAVMGRLRERRVRIITNNAMATGALAGGQCELISTGGEYRDRTRAFCGDFATYIVSKLYADVCILGASGVSLSGGVTTTVYNETMINEMMSRRCNGPTIVAADGSKVGKTHCFNCLPLGDVSLLVTDSSADPDELARMRGQGLQIVIVDE